MIKNFFLRFKEYDLLVFILITSIYGLILLYSASNQNLDLIYKQSIRLLFFILLMFIVSTISISKIRAITPILYLLGLFLLIFSLFFGKTVNGSVRWISFFGLNFQPSEVFKIILPMTIAWFLTLTENSIIDTKKFFICLIIIICPTILILKQPDLGTALIVFLCGVVAIFLAGLNKKYIYFILFFFTTCLAVLWKFFLLPYQKDRISVMFDPSLDPLGMGYQIIQSKIAVGSGGFFGLGFLNGTQGSLQFLPETETDFIFSILAEELGFLGVIILFTLYFLIIYKCKDILFRRANNQYSCIVGGCIAIIFIILIIVNVAMTIGILPVVGVVLPLVSHGGSSLLSIYIAFGIIFSISRGSNEKNMF